jgi:transposase
VTRESNIHAISQVLLNQVTKEIICLAHSKGIEDDFGIFKESKVRFTKGLECLVDKGYQGIEKLPSHSCIPKNKARKAELSAEDKSQNSGLAQKRIVVDRVHRKLKVFRILSSRYRNRHRRFGLRFYLIAGLYNYEFNQVQKFVKARLKEREKICNNST